MKQFYTLKKRSLGFFWVLAVALLHFNNGYAQTVSISNPDDADVIVAGVSFKFQASLTTGYSATAVTYTVKSGSTTVATLSGSTSSPFASTNYNTSSSPLTPGTYTIQVKINYRKTSDHSITGTKTSSSISITVVPAPPTTTDGVICGGNPVTLSATDGDPAGGTYKWYTASSGGSAFYTSTGSTSTYNTSTAGTYYVSYSYKSGGTFYESSRAAVKATASAIPSASFTLSPATVNVGSSATVNYTGTGTASWDFDGGTATLVSGNKYTVTWSVPGTHTVTLTATNAAGCSASSSNTVTVNAVTFGDYGFSKAITLNTSQINVKGSGISSTPLTDFPALVYIQDDALKIFNQCGDKVQYPSGDAPQSDGSIVAATNYDFAFTVPGGTSELNYEVDTFDPVKGILLAWVRIPSMNNVNVPLTFYFGSLHPAHSRTFSAGTWHSDYKAVYHFNEASTSAPVLDATNYRRDAIQFNTDTTNDEIHLAAKISIPGGGYRFNGKDPNTSPNPARLNSSIIQNTGTAPNITGPFTISVWVYYNGTNDSDNKIVSNELDFGRNNNSGGYKLSVKKGVIETETRIAGGTTVGSLGDGGTVDNKGWHYLQGVFDGTSDGTFKNYVDGVADNSVNMLNRESTMVPSNGYMLSMGLDHGKGQDNGGFNDDNFYNGKMDEVRVSNVVKTADWIRAEYYNQTKPIDFTDCGQPVVSFKDNAPALIGAAVYTWTGKSTSAPTDQTQADNWDAGYAPVFNGNTKMVIPVVSSGKYPTLTADASVYSLTIQPGAKINLAKYTLNVGCNIYNNTTTGGTGILYADIASKINWNGKLAAQYYYGTNTPNIAEISSMTVDNSLAGTITITGGPVDIYNTVTLKKGNLLIDNANKGAVTLKSTAAQTAAVAAIPSTYSIKGLVNVERFLTGGGLLSNRGYRLLSSPVNQTQAATSAANTFGLFYLNKHTYGGVNYPGAFTAGIGGTGNGFSVDNNNPTIYLYDETQVFNGKSFTLGNHVPVYKITSGTQTIGASNVNIPIGNGFLMYFVGSAASRTDATTATPPDDATLTANGYINQGDFTVKLWTGSTGKLSYTNADADHPFSGYNMVGNPYPSTIDLDKVLSDNSGSIDNAYVLSAKDSPNQKYIAYTLNGASAPNKNYVVSGEGFFVHATAAGSKTLQFKESQKIPAAQLTGAALIMSAPVAAVSPKGIQGSFAAAVPQQSPLTGLYMKMEKDSNTYDYCGIYFRNDWSARFEDGDAKDMNGTSLTVHLSSLSSDGILASVNHVPDYVKGSSIKLFADARTDGQYKLKIQDIRNIDTLYDIYLLDHYKKDSLDIRRYGSYVFDILKSDTASFGANRFELSVRMKPLPKYDLLSLTAQKAEKGVLITWKTRAEADYTGFVLQKQDGSTFSPLYTRQGDGSGLYSYVDPSPLTGANTYRLQQNSITGALSYSAPITIVYNPAGTTGLMSVYPNPAKATINVNVASTSISDSQGYKADIYNAAGQLMSRKNVNNSWTEDITQYLPGTYIIHLTDKSGNVIGSSKFVKRN